MIDAHTQAKQLGVIQRSLIQYALVERHTHQNFFIQPEFADEWRAAQGLAKRGLVEPFKRTDWKIWLTDMGKQVHEILKDANHD